MSGISSYKATIKQLIVLTYIAENRPTTEYELAKYAKVSSFTAHHASKALVKMGLLKAVPKGKARTGKTIKLYCLTVAGLIGVLQGETVWEYIDKIAVSNRKTLPEYFELWDTFKKFEVDDIAVKLLKYATRKLGSGIPTYPEQIEGRKPTLRDWLPRLAIYPYDAMLEKIISQQEADRWHEMLLEDPRAEKLFLDTLTWMYESHKASTENWRKAIEKHHELKSWHERCQRVVAILESIKDPYEQLKAIKQDRDLWETILQMYQVKDEKELLDKLITEYVG